jgi:hypothetical protein
MPTMTPTEVQQRRSRKRRLGADALHHFDVLPPPNHVSLENDIQLLPENERFISTQAPTSVENSVGADRTVQSEWLRSENFNLYAHYMGSYISSSWDDWSYFSLLYSLLFLWVAYLLFPKGCRRRFCRAIPRRYAKTKWKNEFGNWADNKGVPANSNDGVLARQSTSMSASRFSSSSSTHDSNWIGAEERRRLDRQLFLQELQEAREEGKQQIKDYQRHPEASRQSSVPEHPRQALSAIGTQPRGNRFEKAGSSITSEGNAHDKYQMGYASNISPASSNIWSTTPSGGGPDSVGVIFSTPRATSARKPPSPEHPGISRLPPTKILNETMERLRTRGIRLIAHGVQCDPKRVWIRLDEEITSVTWQTEYPRRIVNQNGEASIVLMRGALHNIALPNVLYVDIGKKTNALMRRENRSIPDSVCFSLLTQNGSLDLQTNSKLERDALVSCFSLVLDQVHTEDWRSLYEESPAPSQTLSSNYDTESFAHVPSDMVEI